MQRQTVIGLADLQGSRSSTSSKTDDGSNEPDCEAHSTHLGSWGTESFASFYALPEGDPSIKGTTISKPLFTVAAVTAGILESRNRRGA